MSLLLILIASMYLASEFRQRLRTPLPSNLGVNYAGLSSCFSLPISLLSSAIYSEAFWQRCWVRISPHSATSTAVYHPPQLTSSCLLPRSPAAPWILLINNRRQRIHIVYVGVPS